MNKELEKMTNQLAPMTKEAIKKALLEVIHSNKDINNLNISNTQWEMILGTCMKHNLNPFLKEVYLISFGGTVAPIVNYIILTNRVREKFPDLKEGWTYNYNKDNTSLISVILHLYNDKMSVQQLVFLSEYSTNRSLWLTKPSTMLMKVARAQCYRLLDRDFSDLYIQEEYDAAKANAKEVKASTIVELPKLEELSELKVEFEKEILTGNVLCPNIIFNEEKHTYTNISDIDNPIDYDCVSNFLGRSESNIDLTRYANEGKEIHKHLSDWILSKKAIELKDIIENELGKAEFGVRNAYNLLNNYENKITFIASELLVASEELKLAGTIDFLAKYESNGETYFIVGDFKRSFSSPSRYANQLYTYKQLLKECYNGDFNYNRKNCRLMIVSCVGNAKNAPKIVCFPITKQNELKEIFNTNVMKHREGGINE